MKTLLDFPRPQDPNEAHVSEVYFYSVFPDVIVWEPEAMSEGEES